MIGYLHIGETRAEIDTIEFGNDCMVIRATLGGNVAATLRGHVKITGSDGTVCWRGTKWHDYGVKTVGGPLGPSTWFITLNADLFDRTNVEITARYDPPVDPP